jgi:hypothetical protein
MAGDHRFTMILSIMSRHFTTTPVAVLDLVMMIDCLDTVFGIRQAHRYEEPVRVRDGSCGAGRTRLSP